MAIKIEKQPDGRYTIRVWARHKDIFGKRKTKQKSNIRTIAVAEREAQIIEDKLSIDEYQEELTFRQLDELYTQARGSKMSPNTIHYNNNHLRPTILQYMGNVKIKSINTRVVQQLINQLEQRENRRTPGKPIRKATVRHYPTYIQAVLNWGVANDYLEYNRVKRLEYRDDDEPFVPTVLEPEDIGDILAFLKRRFYNLYIPVLIAANMGPRRGEALGIKKDALDFDKGILNIKNNRVQVGKDVFDKEKLKTASSRRKLSFSDFVMQEILEHLEMNKGLQSEYVCANVFTGLPTPGYVTHTFHKVMKEFFKIDMRLHDLRHCFNQIGHEEKLDLQERSTALGHSNIKTTQQVYTQFSVKRNREAMNIISNRIKSGFKQSVNESVNGI